MCIEIIITAYNNPNYLIDCIKSLQVQTFSRFKAIIIDDCSQEVLKGSAKHLIENDTRFEFLRNEYNLGGPVSFMNQIRKSDAKYIMWLHHDDWLHPTFIAKAYDALEKNVSCSFAYSLCSRVINGLPRNEFPTAIRPNLTTGVYDISLDTVINCWIMWSSTLIRNESYKKIGGLEALYRRHQGREIKSVYRKGESDLYIFSKLSSFGQAYVINERLCYYRDHSDSNTNNKSLASTHIQDNIRTYDYIFDEIEFFSDEVRLVAKINSIGRLSMNMSFAETAYRILYKSMLGKEFYHNRNDFFSKLKLVMERFIKDDESLGWPKIFQTQEIEMMNEIINSHV